jgi:hypothetical protein
VSALKVKPETVLSDIQHLRELAGMRRALDAQALGDLPRESSCPSISLARTSCTCRQ